ncbi:hypothetical protein [Nocardioides sp. URHA0032]|uniref:hypothetical protein n=1 Tax=Nocardioides sp. URHA0032 TaxID=1380388 RepID=UPI00055AC249|nr:hypothetical protein [Nocardioides sp. URHA0032]
MQTSDYRLATAFGARFAGALLVALALLLVLATLVVALLDLSLGPVVAIGVLGLVAVAVAAYAVLRRVPVVRLGTEGYRVRMVRNVGADRAAWVEVAEAVTATPGGTPVVVLRLRDGRSTTIPVQLLAADREEFVLDLRRHLQDGQGLRPL